MAGEHKSTPLNFLICEACSGTGEVAKSTCKQCRGLAVVLPFYSYYLYWGKKVNRLNIAVDKAIGFADRLLNLVLIVIGLFGLFVLMYVAYQDNFVSLVSLKYWMTPSWEKVVFWFTIMSDMYLLYRLEQATSPRKNVLPRLYGTDAQTFVQSEWKEILHQPKHRLIDVADAYDRNTLELVNQAWSLAEQFNHPEMKRIHLFAVAPQFNEGALVWGRLGIKGEAFSEKIGRVLGWHLDRQGTRTSTSTTVHKVLIASYLHAYEAQKKKVRISDLLESITNTSLMTPEEVDNDFVEKILIEFDLSYQKIINVISWVEIQRQLRLGLQRFRTRARYRSKSGMDRAMTAVVTPFLDKYSTDLTQKAKNGQLFPCIGRDKKFDDMYRVIEGSRAGVLLVGNTGVGRTTIIEGLAQRMVEEVVPEPLKDKRLVSISVAKLIGGASGVEAEQRLLVMAQEVMRAGNIVLVIEDVHNLIGVRGAGSSSLDLAEVLAEVMQKGRFLVFATTTPDELTTRIEKSSLNSTFVPITIEELVLNDAIQVLEAKSGPIEYKNNVFFSYDSIEKAAELSIKFIHDRYLPEKALTIMEEAAVKVRKEKGVRAVITGEDVAQVISDKTGVVATKITEKESEKLLHLEAAIHERVIGQDEAVTLVSSSLRRARAELRDSKRPISSLLFLGPTGVGKTELAKAVASVYFGDENNMLRFDMSEFQDQASVEHLIGGNGKGGVLTEAVRKKPFSLLLFDEIEKAHPDLLNLFLQVMDDGRLTDGSGRTVDFTNTIIIMTSNAGALTIQKEIQNGTPVDEIKELLINTELNKYYRPEFLNRFDGVVVFKPLTMQEVIKIARLMAKKVVARLAEKNITLTITDAAIAELAEKGFDPKFGARPLRRVIQEYVDNMLAEYLLRGDISKRDVVILEPGGELHVEKAEQL